MAVAISLKNRVIINSDTSFKSNNHSNSAMGTPPYPARIVVRYFIL